MLAELKEIFNPKDLREHFESHLADARYIEEFGWQFDNEVGEEPDTHPITVFFETLLQRFEYTFCRHEHMEDQGYGNPDSGCIHVVCLDCKKDFGITWLY